MNDCPSAAHGTSRDPYGCYERERAEERRIERAVAARTKGLAPTYTMTIPEHMVTGSPGPVWDTVVQTRPDPRRPR